MNPWQRFRQRLRALRSGGFRAYITVSRLQSAQVDLAMERWHRERDELDTPPEVEEAMRSQVIALRRQLAA
jgi:hypothetical protein